jgi:small subunit ribosomal protein S5
MSEEKKIENSEKENQEKNIPQAPAAEGVAVAGADVKAAPIVKAVGEDEEFHAAPDQKKKRWAVKAAPIRKKEDSGFIEKVIAINRVTKVTKGGKKMSFGALVVVGDGLGKVGFALEKAQEVSIAIQKSLRIAKRQMIRIPVLKGTIPHEIIGRCGGAEVLLKPAAEGTGVIAAGPVRAICDACGIKNILSKCHRSNNPINVIKATLDGLTHLKRVPASEESKNVSA